MASTVRSAKFVHLHERLHFQLSGKLLPIPLKLEEELEQTATDFFGEPAMPLPADPALPLFAYGLFKPGQLGFASLREHITEVVSRAYVPGALFERDGVPLFDGEQHKVEVCGALISFKSESARTAYERIARLEPEKQYRWETRKTTIGVEANLLVAKSLKGAHQIDDSEWDGRRDPHFNQALNLVESVRSKSDGNHGMGSVERLLELQMAYMLLWTSIERYTSLRYHLRKKVMAKIRHMADEPAFQNALKKHVSCQREVYSTDAGKPAKLSPDDPKASLMYYYQVRSNISHRGKALMTDADLLQKCITELLAIFRETLRMAFEDCRLGGGSPATHL